MHSIPLQAVDDYRHRRYIMAVSGSFPLKTATGGTIMNRLIDPNVSADEAVRAPEPWDLWPEPQDLQSDQEVAAWDPKPPPSIGAAADFDPDLPF
jgi:hypothetical protein